MAYVAATSGEISSGPGRLLPGKVAWPDKVAWHGKLAWAVTALALASAAAAWFAGVTPPSAWVVADAAPSAVLTFNDRFAPGSTADASARMLVQSWSSEIELKLQQAKSRLAQKLQSEKLLPQDFRTAMIDDPKPAVASPSAGGIPLPRARPTEPKFFEAESASTTASTGATAYARPDDRTLLQKFSDLLPMGQIRLASLGPNGGPYHDGPDLGALGYDKGTAVYDISAHAVYLPNGSRLEAHSGMGNLMDDPEHVNMRMVGATPPTTYDLKPREKIFHGVEALRMIPLDASATLGRSGLLTHSFMLGPNGQSNGCVSIRNYDSFLAAYKDGLINRLVVVPSLKDAVVASRQS